MNQRSIVPPVEFFLAQRSWGIHEAVFVLTNWPDEKKLCLVGLGSDISNRLGKCSPIYMPDWPSGSKSMGNEFLKFYSRLRKAIKNGELSVDVQYLPAIRHAYEFVSSREIILWALINGFILPYDLQKALDVRQINRLEFSINDHENVRNKIILQYIMNDRPNVAKHFLSAHDWIVRFGTSKKPKTIRRSIDELIGIYNGLGRPNKNSCFHYSFNPLAEVRQEQEEVVFFNFPLLRTAIFTAIQIYIEIIGFDAFFDMEEEKFVEDFLNEKIIHGYLKGCSNSEKEIAARFTRDRLRQFYSYPIIAVSSREQRKQMKIHQLYDDNGHFNLRATSK